MSLEQLIFIFGGNILAIITIIWMITRNKIMKTEIIKAIIGVALSYLLAIVLGGILLSLVGLIVRNVITNHLLVVFVSTTADILMECVIYLLLFRNNKNIFVIIFYGLIFGICEVLLVSNPYNLGSMIFVNLHFFLHPTFLLIMYYFLNRNNIIKQYFIYLGVFLSISICLLNNFISEYYNVVYPFYFAALMYFSYWYINKYRKIEDNKIAAESDNSFAP